MSGCCGGMRVPACFRVCFLGVYQLLSSSWGYWECFELAFLRRQYGTFSLWFGIPWFRKRVLAFEGNQEKSRGGNKSSGCCCRLQGLTTSCLTSMSSTSPCCSSTAKPGMSTSVRGSMAWPGRSTASACPTAYCPMFTDPRSVPPQVRRLSETRRKSRWTSCCCTDRISKCFSESGL